MFKIFFTLGYNRRDDYWMKPLQGTEFSDPEKIQVLLLFIHNWLCVQYTHVKIINLCSGTPILKRMLSFRVDFKLSSVWSENYQFLPGYPYWTFLLARVVKYSLR